MTTMSSLLELSHELLHCIFAEIQPADLSAVSQSCRALHSYIRGNRLLHRDVYVRRYDEFKEDADWEDLIHRMVKLEKLLKTDDRNAKSHNLDFVANQVNTLIKTADRAQDDSKNIQLLSDSFLSTDNADTLLCASSLFAPGRAGNENQISAATPELRQASAKLHCLYGVPIDVVPSRSFFSLLQRRPNLALAPSLCTRSRVSTWNTHTYARSKVYDLREYTEDTLWGPFMNDGSHRVDWEKVEAVMIVLGYNLRKFCDRCEGRYPTVWKDPFSGATPGSYKSMPRICPVSKDLEQEADKIREPSPSLEAQDPYGVTGTWMRVVCFLDYNDLHAFNFDDEIPADQLREPIDTQEAIRLIRIKLRVTKIVYPTSVSSADKDDVEWDDDSGNDPDYDDDDAFVSKADWRNFQGERLPIVHFQGTSRSLHASWDPNANSKIRGTVRQTPEGEIRWTTFSIFHGEERWRSEGIQIGGLKSARGVLGSWFDVEYDRHGPAGPTAFWKESDELVEEKSPSTSISVGLWFTT